MAQLDPEEAFETLKSRVAEAVADHFPFEGQNRRLEMSKCWVADDLSLDDIRSQREAKLHGRSWAVPVKARLSLIDKTTGEVIDKSTITVAKIPKITRRYSYIVDGKERQVDNQFRLKSGVYHREDEAGRLVTQWNINNWEGAKADRFWSYFHPEKRVFTLKFGSMEDIGLYPVLRAMGEPDDKIKKAWGGEIYDASVKKYGDEKKQLQSLNKILKRTTGGSAETLAEAQAEVRKTLSAAELRKDSTKLTLGKPFAAVNGEAMLTSSKKLLSLARGEAAPDDRESLAFKDVLSIEDHLSDRLHRSRAEIGRRLRQGLDGKKGTVRQIVNPAVFGKPMGSFFSTSLAQMPNQTNPLEFVSGQMRTTIMGPGAVSDLQRVPKEALRINNTHLNYLDPITTPEGAKTGITLQLPLGVEKEGRELRVSLYNRKTKKIDKVAPHDFQGYVVAFSDQVKWAGEMPLPKNAKNVAVAGKGNDVMMRPWNEVTHVMLTSKGMYSLPTNLIPFLHNNQGNRTMTASRMQEQVVSLKHREAPLVQSATDAGEGHTFEQMMGSFNSHQAPVNGVVTKIVKDAVFIRDSTGKEHEVQVYKDFPLNQDEAYLDAHLKVKVGDRVKRGQLLADTNFTKDGTFALGKNLRVGYVPFKGYNFEDGVVISQSASSMLTSLHMYRMSTTIDRNSVFDKAKFLAHISPGTVTTAQMAKLDPRGVIKDGSDVEEGDVLIAKLQKREIGSEAAAYQALKRSKVQDYSNRSVLWDKGYKGKVVRVIRTAKQIEVHIKTEEPAQVGDKLVGRHGNKGIISRIVHDKEMPVTKDGNQIHIALNPHGVPSRINVGQVLETLAGKIAEKSGKAYHVDNFPQEEGKADYGRVVQSELKKHGLSDTEELFDPDTGKKMGDVLIGNQYIFKMKHKVSKKMTSRSGGTSAPYNLDRSPKEGGGTSAQSLSALGLYSMLAHGARHNLREMYTHKSDYNADMWTALHSGQALPAPKIPFTYHKFEGFLKTMGLDVEKKGDEMQLKPLTDKQVLGLSNGHVADPGRMFRGKDMKPEKGGIFDEKIFGSLHPEHADKQRWGHMTLETALPNPLFDNAITSLLDLKKGDIAAIVGHEKEVPGGGKGAEGIEKALRGLDLDAELKKTLTALKGARKYKLSRLRRRVRYLQALKAAELNPADAYMRKHIPIMPPKFRPVSVMDSGNTTAADVNQLYKGLSLTNQKLRDFDPGLPQNQKVPLYRELYDGLKALTMDGQKYQGRHYRGVLETVKGTQPKSGYFQNKIIGRRMDLSMRSTIIPEQSMGLDEVGLPQKAAMEMYKPFVVRELVQVFGYSPLRAQLAVKQNDPVAKKALESVVRDRPVLMKRDPVLHKHGIMAFHPKLVKGKAIRIHPLVTGGFNADFDGDTTAIYVPLTQEAVAEARKMVPSNNLFSASSGRLMNLPSQEAQLGLYQLSKWGKGTGKTFVSADDAIKAYKKGKVTASEEITVGSSVITKTAAWWRGGSHWAPEIDETIKEAGQQKTTVGRLMLANCFPAGSKERQKVLADPALVLTKGAVSSLLAPLAKAHPQRFSITVNKLNQLGNKHTYDTGYSFSLKDVLSRPDIRDKHFAEADREAAKAMKKGKGRDKAVVDAYMGALNKIDAEGKAKMKGTGNRMYEMVQSGARGNWDQFKQLTLAPVLVTDPNGSAVPIPIKKSYSEGLSAAEYWASLSGARMGTLGKVKGTQAPGELTKDLVSANINQLVTSPDCGTTNGVLMSVADSEIHDRYTAVPVKLKKGDVPSKTLLTAEVLTKIKNSGVAQVLVRSPLKCEESEGVCAMCYGVTEAGSSPSLGENVGIWAAQAIGEPATQLSMNAFHTGGVVSKAEASRTDSFTRLGQLLHLTKSLPGEATISSYKGQIMKAEVDPAGGWRVHIRGKDRYGKYFPTPKSHYIPARNKPSDKVMRALRGTLMIEVALGEALSSGPVNPHHLLEVAGIESVKGYLTDEMHGAYGGKVKKRNMETVVRSLTNLSMIKQPGDTGFLRGDMVPTTKLEQVNREIGKKGGKGADHDPVLKGIQEVSMASSEDWMGRLNYRELKKTLTEGGAQGWKTNIHGTNPIPGLVLGTQFGKGTEKKPYAY